MRPETSSLTGSGILFSYKARGMKHLSLSYRMARDGRLAVQLVATPRRGGLPRAGVTFAAAPGRVFTREMLLAKLWGYDFYGDERVVDSHIKNLRHKLGRDYIDTVRGVGYRAAKEDR